MKTQLFLALGAALLASTAMAADTSNGTPKASAFKIVKLDADQKGKAKVVDPNLVDAWGLAQSPGGDVWVSDNGTGLSTVYNRKNGKVDSLVVTIPQGNPTGTVYVPSNIDFQVTENGVSGAAAFLFDSEPGVISGWAPNVDQTNAIVAVNNSGNGGVYKGLALDTSTQQLYAADFCKNQVEVYNPQFQLVNTFTDPSLPSGYAPFNVVDASGTIYVAFAKQDGQQPCLNEVDGASLGYVDVFDTSGHLVKQLIAQGALDAPWGMTIAPSGFGSFGGDLLVGNFGNGWINVYNPTTGAMIGTVSDKKGKPIVINGLWSLDNGPGADQVSFSAGPGAESHGLLGIISPEK
ncbi:MAG: TIGR03118 family protein [Rhizomicrobium sp.]|jgi:uncharacterized protein (TIGR03118 family)